MSMMPFEIAYETVVAHLLKPGAERVSMLESVRRVLAEDVRADIDFPPFDKSAMDGYACRKTDLFHPLEIVETIAAGIPPRKPVSSGQCAKIMTGAKVPAGADCVFMVEQAEEQSDGRIRYIGTKEPGNICWQGEDIRKNEVVLPVGTRICPAHMAVLAGVGCTEPLVAKLPTVEVLVTGTELVPPGEAPGDGQIRETNSSQLMTQLEELGLACTYRGIVPDDPALIEAALLQAMESHEVVLLCGGSSVGDFDYVPELLEKHCEELLIEKVDIKPGKPLMFATKHDGVCFGMPGNPVSTYVLAELFVKPYLLRSMGCAEKPRIVRLRLKEGLKLRCGRRQTFVPVRCASGGVEHIPYHGSAHIHAMCEADGLISLPKGQIHLEAGSEVDVRLF